MAGLFFLLYLQHMLDTTPLQKLQPADNAAAGWLFLLPIIFALIVASQIFDTVPGFWQPFVGLFALAAIAALVVAAVRFIMQAKRITQQNAAAYAAFAARNNFTYTQTAAAAKNGSGTLFTHGHSQATSNVLNGKHASGLPMQLFHYKYDTGSGKNRTTHYASVARLTLPRNVPHMVIDSLVENSSLSVLPIHFDASQQIKVEGDFNQYFALYAPDTYAVSMLSIIGPDVMWALMQHAAACDIEIIDNNIYFYWPLTAQTKADYDRMFATIDAVVGEVGRKLTTGNIYTSEMQAQVHAEAKAQGARLKNGGSFSIIIAMFVAAYALQFVAPEWSAPIVAPLFMFGVITLVAMALLQSARKRKRRQALLHRFGPPQTRA